MGGGGWLCQVLKSSTMTVTSWSDLGRAPLPTEHHCQLANTKGCIRDLRLSKDLLTLFWSVNQPRSRPDGERRESRVAETNRPGWRGRSKSEAHFVVSHRRDCCLESHFEYTFWIIIDCENWRFESWYFNLHLHPFGVIVVKYTLFFLGSMAIYGLLNIF